MRLIWSKWQGSRMITQWLVCLWSYNTVACQLRFERRGLDPWHLRMSCALQRVYWLFCQYYQHDAWLTVSEGCKERQDTGIGDVPIVVEAHHVTVQHPHQLHTDNMIHESHFFIMFIVNRCLTMLNETWLNTQNTYSHNQLHVLILRRHWFLGLHIWPTCIKGKKHIINDKKSLNIFSFSWLGYLSIKRILYKNN